MKRYMFLIVLPICLGACSSTVIRHPGFGSSDISELNSIQADKERSLENLPAPDLIRLGRQYLVKGNPNLARLHFLTAIKKDPDSAAALTGFGDVLAQTSEQKKAEMAYQAALDRLPGYIPALIALGQLHRSTGETEKSLEILQKANEIHPQRAEILSELAITLDQAGRYEEAEPLHLQVTESCPGSSSFNNLGFHYLLRELYPEAVAALEKAVKLAPANRLARNNLAVAQVLSGQAEKAFQLFRDTIGEAAAWNNIGYLYMTQGKRTQAEKAFRRALDLDPQFYRLAKKNLDQLFQKDESITR